MSKQLTTKQYNRSDVDTYHKELRYLVKLTGYWHHGNIELQEFLDQDKELEPEPSEFKDFREAWCSARYSGTLVGVYQNLRAKELIILARNLFASVARRKYYVRFLCGRIKCTSKEGVEPVSIIELEQRYQYYLLYKKNHTHHHSAISPTFKAWRKTDECSTFYDTIG